MFLKILRFSLLLFLFSGLIYLLHYFLLSRFFPGVPVGLLNFSYLINVGYTFLFTTGIILVSRQQKDQIGFIFLISTFLKVGLFLVIIKFSEFELENNMFFHFFTPYLACMLLEIFYIIRILKRANFTIDS